MANKLVKRLLGAFPIFAKDAGVNEVHNLSGKPYDQSDWDNVAEDTLTYEAGFKHRIGKAAECFKDKDDVTPEKLNAMFNFVTNAIAYLYQQGIPEWTMNYEYPKGAVVTYKEKILVSTVDGNSRHPASTMYWKEYVPDVLIQEPKDINPIGTIVTVPTSVNLEGYIAYHQGGSFNEIMYPKLYEVLDTNTFGSVGTSVENELPLGSIVHSLSHTVPSGWIEWDSTSPVLNSYPELKQELLRMVQGLPLGDIRTQWEQALSQNTLPAFEDFFLRSSQYGNIGDYIKDSVTGKDFNIMPVVVDESLTLNPMGIMRAGDDTRIHSPINGHSAVSNTIQETKVVLTGNYVDKYQDIAKANMLNINTGSNGYETAPKHLKTKLLIKAKNSSSVVPSTHKQLIKAFEV